MKCNKRHPVELAGILDTYSAEYLSNHRLCPDQYKAIQAIRSCRTAILGGHLDSCSTCGYQQIAYNSCRNRHCNKCQYLKQEVWVDKLQSNLPNCRYFHIVFTLPGSLHKLFYLNQPQCYDALFKGTALSLQKAGKNPKYLGAQSGAVSVLHTWGQSLTYHPHIHMIVPAGGLSEDHMEWISSRRKFFLPVRVLSKIYRGVLWSRLRKMIVMEQIRLPEGQTLAQIKTWVYQKEWNVYAKKSMSGPESVVKYLGRYTHRVAISNNRLVSMGDGQVSFKWKDYRTNKSDQLITLSAQEFIGRFVRHILPTGFYKIRYTGILACANARLKEICRALIGRESHVSLFDNLSTVQVLEILTGKKTDLCPQCQKESLKPRYCKGSG